ncbi:hypothetical protein LUZ60_010462 [Juncus effusus]|nr:hypothetical protein LUZ60_010462 [Juncus effusus]
MDRVSDRSSRHRDRDRDHKHKHHRKSRDDDHSPSDRRRELERSRSAEREGSRKRKDYDEDGVEEREREKEWKRSKEDGNGEYRRESGRFSDRKESRSKDEGLRESKNNEEIQKNGSKADDSAKESNALEPKDSEIDHHSTKVSLNTSNEKEGVRIRSDGIENGKSSTDEVASISNNNVASKSSRDALAMAKKALQLQKELKEKMKKIPLLNKTLTPTSTSQQDSKSSPKPAIPAPPKPGITSSIPGIIPTIQNLEAVKRAQERAAQMGFRQDPEFAPLINMFPGSNNTVADVAAAHRPGKAPVLRLDPQGREVDEHGNVVSGSKPTNISTLKVNINKQKKDAFQIIKPDFEAIAQSTSHFDPDMGINKNRLLRPKRPSFQFVEEGAMSKIAESQRIRSQFGEAHAKEMKVKQAQLAKAKAEPDINPNLIAVAPRVPAKQLKQKDEIPDVEWWDKPILLSGVYEDSITKEALNKDKITKYAEHPRPIEPPAEPAPPPPQPLKLTKKEQKKLRTQRRLAKEKDRQEMIRQGLLEPPKPKVKMSNLMRVLGSEATQDPTRLEMEVRSAAVEREQAHVDRNTARKLTPAEKREKKERKLFDDPNNVETLVSVYKIRVLKDPKTRFKVDVNAKENRLTGCVVISDELTVVVVEGGKKSIKRYNKLMMNRIDWASVPTGEDDEMEGTEEMERINECVLVWQGSVGKASFNRFLVHECRSEQAAKKVFADAGVPHYWDLAVNFNEEV